MLTLNADGSFVYDTARRLLGRGQLHLYGRGRRRRQRHRDGGARRRPGRAAFRAAHQCRRDAYTAVERSAVRRRHLLQRAAASSPKPNRSRGPRTTRCSRPSASAPAASATRSRSSPAATRSRSTSPSCRSTRPASGCLTSQIEGKTVFDDLDIWAAAGDQYTAYNPRPIIVNVIDGELDIQFVKWLQNPKVSAISVIDVTSQRQRADRAERSAAVRRSAHRRRDRRPRQRHRLRRRCRCKSFRSAARRRSARFRSTTPARRAIRPTTISSTPRTAAAPASTHSATRSPTAPARPRRRR